jgi:hypothetical protein
MMLVRVAVCFVLSATLCSTALTAQEIQGTLRRSDGAPAPGVVVLAEDVRDGRVVGRTVTGEAGTYRVAVTTDSLRIRALRIGQQPQVLGFVRLQSGARFELSQTLDDVPVMLTRLAARVDSRCEVRPDGAALVAQLFAQARTALLASQLVSSDGRPRTRYRLLREEWTPNEQKLTSSFAADFVSDSLRPFQSVPADSLASAGYVARQRDGSTAYRAPDADLLVDDRFLSLYCLHLVEGSEDRAEWIGVGFKPARLRRGIVEVEGTLWLDRATNELRRVEYGYVGLDPAAGRTKPGGWVEYSRLSSGVWFVSRWEIRMPRVAQHVVASARDLVAHQSVLGVHRIGGEVLEVSLNGRTRYTAGATDVVTETGAIMQGPAELHVDASSCTDVLDASTLVYGTVRGAGGRALAGAAVRVVWNDPRAASPSVPETARAGAGTVTVLTDSSGVYRACGVPRDRVVDVQFSAASHQSAAVTLRAGITRQVANVDFMLAFAAPAAADGATAQLDIAGAMQAVDSGLAAGVSSVVTRNAPRAVAASSAVLRVVDAARQPVSAARVEMPDGSVRASDDAGIVLLRDTSALTLPVVVQRIGFQPYRGVATRANVYAPFVVQIEALPRQIAAIETEATRPPTMLYVVDADSIPIPYAMVTLGNNAPRAADSTGRVLLGSEDRLTMDARAQRIGYRPYNGKLTRTGIDKPFTLVLEHAGNQLGAVRTIAPRHTMLSRTGFYDRMTQVKRGAILGEFISPEELDLRLVGGSVANVLYGRQYVTVMSGQLYGRGNCRMQVLVDGKRTEGNSIGVPGNEVMAIEIYPSTANAPAELIPLTLRGSCGIVAIWTGPRR